MPKKIKKHQPRIQSKLISAPPPININHDNNTPIFSFRYLEDNYSISKCQKEEKIAFVDKMTNISKLKWRDLLLTQRHGLGCEKISRESLSNIPTKITPDVSFIAFRFCGLASMIGFRDKDIFHIVRFDRNFKIYKH